MSERLKYLPQVSRSAEQYGVPPGILDGVLQTESGYATDVITGQRLSSAGAAGIGQFMPDTARAYGIDPLNPNEAIPAAAKYLRTEYERFGNWAQAVAAYNAGGGGVQNAIQEANDFGGSWMDYLPEETRIYVPRVFANQGMEFQQINPGNLAVNIPVIGNPLPAIMDAGEGIGRVLGNVLDPKFWARIGFTLAGGILVLVGVGIYAANTGTGKRAIEAAATRGMSEVT